MPANQEIWGEEVNEMGFEGHSEQLQVWTEHLCFLAEEYEAQFGEMLEVALRDAGKNIAWSLNYALDALPS
ncbi:hypothetical protein PILCRDRAFT_13430 [Piloderma croceum F 1598]|uniref:Uncharacterized protein n=1 Tax=Piloderma croceum (strain F 1598) TaxID=765440 RepID=A0A0C3AP55_PILCF|nr:hypothetical protein PILCRDRAFT_13430 [Piloderma croceum F 1598]